jgi:hypothetical protein
MWHAPSHIIDCGSLLDVVNSPTIIFICVGQSLRRFSSPQPQYFKDSLFGLLVFPEVSPKGLFPLWEVKLC